MKLAADRCRQVTVFLILSCGWFLVLSAPAAGETTAADATTGVVPISITFNDIGLRQAIQIIADELGHELVLDESVSGNISLQIEDVDPWQALDIVLNSRDLEVRIKGSLMRIAPMCVFLARDGEAQRMQEAMAALQTEYLQVNYADVAVILALVIGEAEKSGGLLSERGSANMDARTNTLIVRDIGARLADVKELLLKLDVPVRQVLIETRIVSASTEVGRQLGARWGAFSADSASATPKTEAGTLGDLDGGLTFFADHRQASTVAASVLRRSLLLELELSALENSGQAELIARPRVTTQDNMPASIRSGVRIPYQAQAGGTAGGSITEFVDAVLSLDVTPLITPDGRIIMQLGIRQDSVASGSGDVPAINTNTVNTRVLVDNGDTLVLGGIFRDEHTREDIRTPLLGEVPVLGRLFQRSQQASRRTELLIFITPQIVQP
jgi:type IV pilus assembly protein PilQ